MAAAARKKQMPPMTADIDKYYTVTPDVLGQGYFAVVKVGIDKKTGEKVAVKLVNKSLVEKEETLANEIDILGSIDHPNVVSMKAIFDTEDTLFIVMELMEGGELYEEIVKRKTFTEKDAAEIVRQLCEALAYLHERGIVHRDLKLENLLLKKKGGLEIKLADFGLSKLYSGQALQTACGTPFYVAPDVLMGTGYGPAVDMWSVGVLLYVLLSGRLPFAADSDAELFRLIIAGNLVWKSPQFDGVSSEAKDLIKKLINTEPEQRWSAKQAIEHPWVKKLATDKAVHGTMQQGLKTLSAESKARLNAGNKKKE
jgi:calcium/calmodulin-dependent protein kinase I